MNSSQLYKDMLRRKRTYFRALALALLLFALATLDGMYHGYEEEAFAENFAQEDTLEEAPRESSQVPYIEHFKRNAPSVGWDWELLAAVAYHESRFCPTTVSPSGAQGLMQIMPVTGQKFGLNDSTFLLPKDNIEAGCKYIRRLQNHFRDITDLQEQTKFVLASYNAGPAHIHDARALARKYGANPSRWDDVEYYISMLRYEEYYTDSVVKYGLFKGRETLAYVHNTLRTYRQIRQGEFNPKRQRIWAPAPAPDTASITPDSSDLTPAFIPSPMVSPSVVAAHTVAIPLPTSSPNASPASSPHASPNASSTSSPYAPDSVLSASSHPDAHSASSHPEAHSKAITAYPNP